jgi:hypothetical protein
MPPKKEKTKKQTTKRDFLDFMKDASKPAERLGKDWVDLLNKRGTEAKDLKKFLQGWGYAGVSLKDCTKLLGIAKTLRHIDYGGLEKQY